MEKSQIDQLQEAIAQTIDGCSGIIRILIKNPEDFNTYIDDVPETIEIKIQDFKKWWDTLYRCRSIEETTKQTLDFINSLSNIAEMFRDKPKQDFDYSQKSQQMLYYSGQIFFAKKELEQCSLQDSPQTLTEWPSKRKLLEHLFQQAYIQLLTLQDVVVIQKNFQNNNVKTKDLIHQIENLNQQSKDIATNIQQKEQLTQDTRTAIEKAIKVKLNEKYENQAEKLKKEEAWWTRNVYLGLFGLFLIGLYEIILFVRITKTISFSPYQLLGLIPIHLAIIWFIIFSINRRNEASRLACDYAHKEVFASSYLAYQNEINELKGKHTPEVQELITQLNVKLIDSMIDTLSDNPAKNLDSKKKSSELPTKEIINLVSEVTKIKNFTPIPQIPISQSQQEKEQAQ